MIVTLAKTFNEAPHSVYSYILKPLDTKKGASANWKTVRGRLEVLHRVIEDCGLGDSGGRKGRGASLEAVMDFTEPQLHHSNADVREVAVKIVVDLMRTCGEDFVLPYLQKLRPQQMQTIKTKLAEANGISVKRGSKSRPRKWSFRLLPMRNPYFNEYFYSPPMGAHSH